MATNLNKKKDKNAPKRGRSLDTLGIVSPKAEKGESEAHKKFVSRQIAKAYTNSYLYKLIDLDSRLKKSYWSTYHCCRGLDQKGYKITSTYCDQRWCTQCNRIRMAKMINAYGVPLLSIPNLQFITLTAPNVKGDELKMEIDSFMRSWRKIYKAIKKSNKGIKLQGMRKLECTYNPNRNDFNPHFHMLIGGESISNEILDRWLSCNPKADRLAQDIRPADDGSLIELFKYASKQVVKGKFNAHANDTIFQSMYYRKTYYPVGIRKVAEENIDGIQSEEIKFKGFRDTVWKWSNEAKDWKEIKTGELFTGYVLNENLDSEFDELSESDTESVRINISRDELNFINDNIGYEF